jgi:hypothetical protein
MRNEELKFNLEKTDPRLEPLQEAEEEARSRQGPPSPNLADGAYYFVVDSSDEIESAEIRVGRVELQESYRTNQLQNPVRGFFEGIMRNDELTIWQTTDRWTPHYEWTESGSIHIPIKVDEQIVKDLNDYLMHEGMYESL